MKRRIVLIAAIAVAPAALTFAQDPIYKDVHVSIEKRVADLVQRMTLEEKIDILGGKGFDTKPIERLGIPRFKMADGPVGVRKGKSTAFPSGIAMAATWDPGLIRRIGVALGEEAIGHDRNTLLGPCVNIQRVPHGGRNFESFGEDPFLASRIAADYIKGVQSTGVIATVKHFAVNNQETAREQVNVKLSERALREIYLPAFETSVKEAGVGAVMDAYNKVNGWYCTANKHLNIEILKQEWGFKGVLMSDWGATHNTLEAANGGLDLEMPTGEYFNKFLLALVRDDKVSQATIDDKVSRILSTMMTFGFFDNPRTADSSLVDSRAHRILNRETARNAMVLLKNDGGVLPFDRKTIRSIAIIGPNAATARVGGGGSSIIDYTYAISPLDGIRAGMGGDGLVNYSLGCAIEGDIKPIDSTLLHPSEDRLGEYGLIGEYFPNRSLSGAPVVSRLDPTVYFDWKEGSPDPKIAVDSFSVRWTGVLIPKESGTYTFQVASDDGNRLFLDNKFLIDDWNDHGLNPSSAIVSLEKGRMYRIRLEYYEHAGAAVVQFGLVLRSNSEKEDAAVKTAASSDAAVVCVGYSFSRESEGFDRKTLDLPEEQVSLIKAVARVNPRTIVVLNSGAPVLMSGWLHDVPALIEQWYPGQEGGNALADILFGEANPSGKLPCTFPVRWEDCSAYGSFPGTADSTEYADDILVGYRHFDARKIEPQFPFGFGLSYTTFEYTNLRLEQPEGQPLSVMFSVRNAGTKAGAEVAQVYVAGPRTGLPRPPKELKGFAKVFLAPGEERSVTVPLDRRAFSVFDPGKNDWTVEPGEYQVLVGSSSRHIRFWQSLTIH
jgi:beta-glucosidase